VRSRPVATGSGKEADLTGDDEVCKLIVDKFEKLGGRDVSYADIAKRAWEVGRPGLATKVSLSNNIFHLSWELIIAAAFGL